MLEIGDIKEITLYLLAAYLFLFIAVYFVLGVAVVTVKWLKLALNWLLPPLSDG